MDRRKDQWNNKHGKVQSCVSATKNHSAKNISRRSFCLEPNERELSNLLILSILSEGPIGRWRCLTFSKENDNPVSLEYVKMSKTDFNFFLDNFSIISQKQNYQKFAVHFLYKFHIYQILICCNVQIMQKDNYNDLSQRLFQYNHSVLHIFFFKFWPPMKHKC